jgi:predicted RecB family endonuclease
VARRRRNRESEIALGVAQLIALLVLAGMFVPQVRQILLGLGGILVGAVILLGVVALGVFLIRRTERNSPLPAPPVTNLDAAVPVQTNQSEKKPRTTIDLIEQLRVIDWFQFEKVVALTYRKLGYTVSRRGGANPDGGIDLVIEKDGQRAAVQCKQWKTWNVGVKAVREFLGALTDARIERGILVTLGGYTGDAKQLSDKHGISMLNETELATMLESVDAKFDPQVLELLRDVRKFCPKCENEMILRMAKKGLGAGRQFWGCSMYPKCRFTIPVQ